MLLHLLIISSYCRVGRDYKTSTVVHSPVDGHLSCFLTLAHECVAINNDATYVHRRLCVEICFYSLG
jgi:hypothetical protein